VNKQQLVDAVGERLGDRKTASTAVDAVLETVSGTLAAGERVSLFGFGVFEKVERAARTARNPSTGGTVQVPATSVPRFRAGQALKDAVNGGSSRTTARRTAEVAEPSATKAGTKKAKGKADTKKAKDKDKDKAKDKAKPSAKSKAKKK
jgi:DNA-binding protein HU-beta